MRIDPITLAVFNHRLSAIAEEMGTVLCRSAFSANIKERRDFSCALFDARGALLAQAAHIPVHLGSAALAVAAAIATYRLEPGDTVILNDPFAGGTHLPDVTLVAPIYLPRQRQPFGYVANRAHHADIGGGAPGSIPLATEIYGEGLRIPPVRLCRRGVMVDDVLRLFLANTRVDEERRGDLQAQLAALRIGERRVQELVAAHGVRLVRAACSELRRYSARRMRAALKCLPAGSYEAVDWLDDDGAGTRHIPIRVRVEIGDDGARVDFTGSAAQIAGGVNANFAITLAAVLYCFQLLADGEIPANAGLLEAIDIIAPPGSIVNAQFPAAVAGGNVETSQRIVDVVLRALAQAAPDRIPAASAGSMNNLALGGYDEQRRRHFAYYETIAGGAGAGPRHDGASGLQTHMTNTLNTPIEAIESAYPMRVVRYALRRSSGGVGRHRGGDGIIREIELLQPAFVTLLTERRVLGPYGLGGGEAGAAGRNQRIRAGRTSSLPSKIGFAAKPGDRIVIRTPGAGGWGRRNRAKRRPP